VDGYLDMLLQMAFDISQREPLRTSAASQFKDVVKRRWNLKTAVKESIQFTEVKEAEKAVLRGNILGALVTKVVPVRNLLEDALRVMVANDYPALWPSLPEEIMSALNTDSQEQIIAALIALRAVIRRYDETEGQGRDQLFHVADGTFPILKNLLEYLLQNDSVESQEVQLLILKVVWDGTIYGLPHCMRDQAFFDSWMQMFLVIFSQPVPVTADMDEGTYNKLPWWYTKKWVLHFWIRFCNRFLRITAKRDSDSEDFRGFFVQTYPSLLLSKTFEALGAITEGFKWPSPILCKLLDFLHTCLTFSSLWQEIKPHSWNIIRGVFVPMLQFNEEDLYTFEYEPDTYISNQLDPLQDEMNPRTPALTFIFDLAKHREPIWLQDVIAYLITEIFRPYQSAGSVEVKISLANLKYAGLDILGTMSALLKESEEYLSTIEQMLVDYVIPDMHEGPAWLRAKACWAFSRYCRIKWEDENNVLAGVDGLLKNVLEAEELPLVADAAVALFDIIPNATARPVLGPLVPDLVNKYLTLMERVDNDAIVGSLQYLMRYFPRPMAKSAGSLMHNLSVAFLRADHNSNQITLGDDTESDNAFMAASQTIRAIHTLFKSVRKSPSLYPILEQEVIPILTLGLGPKGNSYLEDCLALMTEITYHAPTPFSPGMWKLFDLLCTAYMTFAGDYMQTILPSLDNFMSRDKETFLANPRYLGQICDFATKYFVIPKYPELDLLPLTRVFETLLLEYIGMIDHIIEPLLKLTVERIAMGGSNPIIVILLELVMNCMYYNAEITVHWLETNGFAADVMKTMFDLIVSDEFERVCDKKTASLGIGAMLRLPFDSLPPYVQERFLEIVSTYMQLTDETETQRIAEMADAEDDEDYDGSEWEGEDDEMEETDEDDDDDWGDVLNSDDEDMEDEEQLEQAIAMMKAQQEEEGEELDEDDLHALSGTVRIVDDSQDLPDAYGPAGPLTERMIDSTLQQGWTLRGQEASDELPTEKVNEIIFLAETLEGMNQTIKDQLFTSFTTEISELYQKLMEVANDKAEKAAFEEQIKVEKAAKREELQSYYQASRRG
jgi:hypothetical protein